MVFDWCICLHYPFQICFLLLCGLLCQESGITVWRILNKTLIFQLGKASGRFHYWSHAGYGFGSWNRWRMEDGMLCRTSNDCQWLDSKLECDSYKFGWNIDKDWFDGDWESVVGTCDCIEGRRWSNDQVQCLVRKILIGI